MELFKLFGTIAINNADANRSIDETADKAKEAGSEFDNLADKGQQAESKLSKFMSGMGRVAAVSGKAIAAGLAVASTAVTAVGKAAISSYADYEQLVGGVETLFDESSATVIANAQNAYKTAGMSANEYMETVTSFSASLLQSLGGDTKAAADKADMAITDMSDNANKMGTSIEMIQNAYNGFAKQNYTMLDNLKLGYGGTKEEMQRLLDDASKLSGIEYDISSYSDIVDAIHIVQNEMGITGTTAKEASSTISGSLASAKASWQNLLTGLADGNQDVGGLITQFFDSIVTVADNIVPRIAQVMETLPQLITNLVPKLLSKVSSIVDTLLPALVSGAASLLNAVVEALPNIISTLTGVLPTLVSGIEQIVSSLVTALPPILESLITGIVGILPQLLPLLIDGVIGLIVSLFSNISMLLQPIIDALPGIIISVVDALMQNLPALIEGCVQLVIGVVQAIPQIILSLIEALPTIITSIVQGLWNALPILLQGIISIIGEVGKAIWQILSGFFTAIGEWFGSLWQSIKDILSPVIEWFGNLFSSAWEGIKNAFAAVGDFFSGIWNKIKGAFSAVGTFFKDAFSKAWNAVKNVFSGVGNFFTGIWDKIKNAFSALGTKIGDAISGAVKKGINGMLGLVEGIINGFLKLINGAISAINLIPGVNISKIQMVSFTRLAKGGVVDEPTPAVFGEDGAEAVVPLENNTGWIRNVAKQLHSFVLETKDSSKDVAGSIRTQQLEYAYEQNEKAKLTLIDAIDARFEQLIEILSEYFPAFADGQHLYVDGRELANCIAEPMDKELGKRYHHLQRGNCGI